MAQKDDGNKVPIYKLKKTDEVMEYYDEWGKNNKYDQDMVDWNYTGPKETSEVFIKYEKIKMPKFMMRVVVLGWLVLNSKNMVLPIFMVLTFQENY